MPNAYFAKHFTEEPRQNAIQAPSTRQGPSTGKLKECLPSECTDDELRSAVSQAEALHAMAENISQRLSAQNECDNNMRSAGQNGLENYGASQGSEEGINLSQSVAEGHPTITATADEVASNESGCNERVVGSADTRHSSEVCHYATNTLLLVLQMYCNCKIQPKKKTTNSISQKVVVGLSLVFR